MAVLAYNLGKREINQYFTIKNAKLLAVVAVIVLVVFHSVSRYYGGRDTCEWLLSSGRFLGDNVWQPYGCMMHKYKINEAKTCLSNKRVAFIGDSRIRQLFYSFIQIINPEIREYGTKHENIPFADRKSSVNVDFLWCVEVNNSMKALLTSWRERPSIQPDVIIIGAATWSIKLHRGSSETLIQYKENLTSMVPTLEKLTERSEVYWVLQDPVYEEVMNEDHKIITNQQIDLYNAAALSALNNSKRNGKARVKILEASRQVAMETVTQSEDGLHLPVRTRDVSAMILMNSICNKILTPIDGSCCQSVPPLSVLQKLAVGLFLAAAACFLILHILGYSRHWKSSPVPDVESGEGKKPPTAVVHLSLKSVLHPICKMGLIMLYFYLCDRGNVFMKEQKFYTHSSFFFPLIYIFVLGIFYSENSKETKLLNRDQTDEWKGWMQLVILIYHISGASAFIPVYMHVRVLVAAYLFQTGYGHFSFFCLKGDFGLYRVCQVLFRLNFLVAVLCLVMDRPYQFYYFVPLVTFWFVVIYIAMAMWPRILQLKDNGSGFWHLAILMKLLALILFICFVSYSQGFFESVFSIWPISKLFELQGSIHEWWFRWNLDRFAVFHGMLFAFLYLALQKLQVLSEAKGESLFSHKISNCLLFIAVLSFLTYSIWASSCKDKSECNAMHPYISMVQVNPVSLSIFLIRRCDQAHIRHQGGPISNTVEPWNSNLISSRRSLNLFDLFKVGITFPIRSNILAFVLIRNIPGYFRSLYSSFFAWFGKISLELFICQYHIWLAADTKGILVLIPGNPSLNIIISTFIFVCVAHEVSQITNDLAQVAIPKDNGALLKRLLAIGIFMGFVLLLSSSSLSG